MDREKESQEIIQALLDPHIPIVTVIGIGGIGKTVLALEGAYRLLEQGQFAGGICWLNCQGSDNTLDAILHTIQATFGLALAPTAKDEVRRYLRTHPCLLVLDGYDAVAQDMEILAFLERLPESSTTLLTSREHIRLHRHIWMLSLDGLITQDAVRLFVETADRRGLRVPPEQTALIAEICQLLEGHPLAILLAAAQAVSMSLPLDTLKKRIAEGLRAPNLEVAFKASYERLGENARVLLWRLSVFAADVDNEAVENVCQVGSWQEAWSELLRSALVIEQDGRCALHPAVRPFALKLLEEAGEREKYEERAAEYYLRLAEAITDFLTTGAAPAGLDAFRAELTNMQAGMQWYRQHQRWDVVIRYGIVLDSLLHLSGYETGRELVLQEALDAAKRVGDKTKLSILLYRLGTALQESSRYDEAIRYYQQTLDFSKDVGDLLTQANALQALGTVYQLLDRYDEAQHSYEQALSAYQRIGARTGEANALKAVGDVQNFRKEMGAALASYQQALAIYRMVGDRLGEANVLQAIGGVQSFRKEMEAALASYQQALDLYRSVRDRLGEANVLQAIGDVLNFRKDLDAALASYQQAVMFYREIGVRLGEANALRAIGDVQNFRKEMDAALESYKQALAIYRETGARLGEANALKAIGDVQSFRKDVEAALESYQPALAIYRELGDRLGEANVLQAIGDIQDSQGEQKTAMASYQQALVLYRAVGGRLGEANTLMALGDVHLDRREYEEAKQIYMQTLEIYRAIRDLYSQALVLVRLGNVYKATGDFASALSAYESALDIGERIGLASLVSVAHRMIASLEIERDNINVGIDHFAQALILSVKARARPVLETARQVVEDSKRLVAREKFADALILTSRLEATLDDIEREANAIYEIPLSSGEAEIYHMLKEPAPTYKTLISYDSQAIEAATLLKSILSVIASVASARMDGSPPTQYNQALQALELARGVDRATAGMLELAKWVREASGYEFVELEEADRWPPRLAYLVHLSTRYERDENWAAAIDAYRQARALLDPNKGEEELRRYTELGFRLGLCLKQDGRWSEALEQQEENVAGYKKLGNPYGKASAYLEMGHIYQMMNIYDLALLYYGEAYYLYQQAAEEARDEAAHQLAQRGMADAKESLGDLEFQLKLLPQAFTDLEEAAKLYLILDIPGKAAIIRQTLESAQVPAGGVYG